MNWVVFLALSWLPGLVAGSVPIYKVKETVPLPKHWVKHSLPASNLTVTLKIGLAQSDFDTLERHLYQVSDPDHSNYGNHLSKAEVEALVSPKPETLMLVETWLASHGIADDQLAWSSASDWITLSLPLSLAETMLNTTYFVWKHVASEEYLVRTTSYSLPLDIHHHIDVIQPTTNFAQFKNHRSTLHRVADNAATAIPPDASCQYATTLRCIQQTYNATGYKPSPHVDNSIAVTGYLDFYANIKDLQMFYKDQRPEAVNSSFEFVSVHGGINPQDPQLAGDEADLDVQFAFGLSYPIKSTFYSTAGSPPFNPNNHTTSNTNEPYTDWLDFILKEEQPPLAISTSYGDDEDTVPESFAIRVCKGFAQLGARGVSLMFSSGDSGVGDGESDPSYQTCQANDGTGRTRFIPIFPASCPYVTAVGGTQLTVNPNEPETAASLSGGGFSWYFPRPSYQDTAVKTFLKKLPHGTYNGLFNPDGRGIPDVSALSANFRIVWRGGIAYERGTSAAAPTFTGLVALLNDARLRAGKKPLGFLNPLLYSKGLLGFNDVTSGNAPGCGTDGFNATAGWDPVTGLGSIDFGKLREIVTR